MTKGLRGNEKVGATFQGVAFLITLTCLLFFYSYFYYRFITPDPPMPLDQSQKSDQRVVVGLHVTHFSTFDVSQNKFTMDGTIWFLFNPKEISLEAIKKFNIFNGTLQHISDPTVIDHGDAKIAQFRIQAEFHTPLNYRMFPLDDHQVRLVVYNRFLPEQVTLQSGKNDITFSSSLFIPAWRIVSHEVDTGIRKIILEKDNMAYSDEQQETIITFNCERTDPSILVNILLSLLLMLFLAMLTFSSDEDSVLIVSVGIVALIGYRSVMHAMSPPLVSYFIYSDYMYLFALVGVVVTLFAGIITRDRSNSKTTKKIWIAGIYTLFTTACILTCLLLS